MKKLLHVQTESRCYVPGADGGMWDWFGPSGRLDHRETATEVAYPKRLVQQTESEEEMAHDYLNTRVRNGTGDGSVSCYRSNFPSVPSQLITVLFSFAL